MVHSTLAHSRFHGQRDVEREAVLDDELVERPDAEAAPTGCGTGGSRSGPSSDSAWYSLTVSVSDVAELAASRLPEVAWWMAWVRRQ